MTINIPHHYPPYREFSKNQYKMSLDSESCICVKIYWKLNVDTDSDSCIFVIYLKNILENLQSIKHILHRN